MFHSKVVVTLRKSILDPQGKAVEHGIHALGFNGVKNVRIGKCIEFDIEAGSKAEAEKLTHEACRKLLANPVMEDFTVTLEEIGNPVHA